MQSVWLLVCVWVDTDLATNYCGPRSIPINRATGSPRLRGPVLVKSTGPRARRKGDQAA